MNVVCFGAHPDDCEVFAGGTCVLCAQHGHRVLLVSVTNGDAGHQTQSGEGLARRRAAEAALSAQRGGCEHRVLDVHDGELQPTLELRKEVVRIIRDFRADVVLSHRPNDYHPDHRYTAQLIQDAAFMVTVPNFCPETPRLERNPVFLYLMDPFQRPMPFTPDVAVAVDEVMDTKWAMLDAMTSQMYEWLPWLEGKFDSVPEGASARREWLQKTWSPFFERPTQTWRSALAKWYGTRAAHVTYAEFFEISEYGSRPNDEDIRRLFPFLPNTARG